MKMSAPDEQSTAQFVTEARTNDSTVDNIATETIAKPEIGLASPLVSCQSHPLNLTSSNYNEGPNDAPPTSPQSSVYVTSQKKSKRVVFPNDGNVVLGFMPPRAPWNDASSCSTDDLLGAYRRSCDKHGVRPLTKLMQQLGAVTDFSEKKDSLILRGESLDSRHVETLEEVFRRLQYHTMDMEATRLDEEGAVALFEMIEYYESCTKLNISYNKNLGNRGWQACSRMIKKTPGLIHLEVRGCTFPEQMMPCFGRALRMGSVLTVLHMENTSLSGRPLLILVAAIKMNEILKELYLADNKLMPSDGIQLGSMLKYNHKLQLLDVRNNHLQDLGTSNISDGIWEQNQEQGLNTLVLWNNQVTYQSMASMRRALLNTKSLETLNLGHNNLTTEGIHRLKEGLLQNKSLKRIGLQASKITCEGAVALAEFIAESSRLMRLDLRENDIKTAGLMALSLSLKVSQSVTRIDLDKDPKRENSMRDYVEQQTRLLKDISNYMMRNRELQRQQEEAEAARQKQILAEEAEKLANEAERLTNEMNKPEENNQAETDSHQHETENEVVETEDKETVQSVATEVTNQEVKVESETEKSNPRRKFTLNLVEPPPPMVSSSLTLESPKFTQDSQLPVVSDNLCDMGVSSPVDGEGILAGHATITPEFPLSPMMSDQGHPMLAPLIHDTALLHNIPHDVQPFRRSSSDKTSVESGEVLSQSTEVLDQLAVDERIVVPSQSPVSEVTEVLDQSSVNEVTEDTEDCVLGSFRSTTDSLLLVHGDIQDELEAGLQTSEFLIDHHSESIDMSTNNTEQDCQPGSATEDVLGVSANAVTEGGDEVTEGDEKINDACEEVSERGDEITEGSDKETEGGLYVTDKGDQVTEVDQVIKGGDQLTEEEDQVTEGGDQVTEGGDQVTEGGDQVTEGGDQVTEGGDQVTEGGDQVTEGDRVSERGDRVTEGGDQVTEGGDQVTERGCEVTELGEESTSSWEHVTHKPAEGLLDTALGLNGMRAELANVLNDLVIKSDTTSTENPHGSSAPS